MKSLFRHLDVDLSEEEFNETMQGLIDKSLARKVFNEGVEYFEITDLGKAISLHLDSDPALKN